ncbi:large-conductance mechanosensitive channel protein MscL [Lewinella sp. 4G2]|uniref:large-conductance mechanosensitive channel protein MscL n=1 Tax=Lewinella sp. 4G2 TaxID=1803372 RepID=UPI0007B4CFBE|nr:large-conductance mechanosensitive channel protein MscL [Lewinella sp. 4G2]OAV45835.1 mechanosensitive ion channel protein MscL [Lewinella sp. 4G2]
MLQEFKAFIMKGNVLELAVAVIIAGAFGAIVTSMTADIIMPIVGLVVGGVDFTELAIQLSPDVVAADGTVTEGAAIRYGIFIQRVIDFLIVAFIVFMIVRSYNKMTAPKVVEPAPDPGPTEKDILIEIRDQLAKRP